MNDEDWWYLVRDTSTGRVFIKHVWEHTDVRKMGKADRGSEHIELSVFLNHQGKAQDELHKLIGSLVSEA